jgi:hypothetical protein
VTRGRDRVRACCWVAEEVLKHQAFLPREDTGQERQAFLGAQVAPELKQGDSRVAERGQRGPSKPGGPASTRYRLVLHGSHHDEASLPVRVGKDHYH